MYVLDKFQLCIVEVTALQSSSNRKIDLYSKHRENKPQTLPKTDVTYEWSKVRTRILHHHVYHELRNVLRKLSHWYLKTPDGDLIKLL